MFRGKIKYRGNSFVYFGEQPDSTVVVRWRQDKSGQGRNGRKVLRWGAPGKIRDEEEI